eukprot:1144884-Pelagomonas_calceolata.AAC.5
MAMSRVAGKKRREAILEVFVKNMSKAWKLAMTYHAPFQNVKGDAIGNGVPSGNELTQQT